MKARLKPAFIIIILILIIWTIVKRLPTQFTRVEDSAKEPQRVPPIAPPTLEIINLTVYYESLCSDSRSFFLKQLLPTYTLLSKHLSIKLVPYGKAKTIDNNGKLEFKCQHGSTECLGNKIHACSIDVIKDPLRRLEMVACMIDDNMMPFDAAERCAYRNHADFNAIVECANSDRGSFLLKQYGEETKAVTPTITFIPTVVCDCPQHVSLSELLKDLKKQLCDAFKVKPKECS